MKDCKFVFVLAVAAPTLVGAVEADRGGIFGARNRPELPEGMPARPETSPAFLLGSEKLGPILARSTLI